MVDIIPGLKGFGTDTRAAYDAENPPEICIVNSLGTAPGNPSWDSAYGANNIGVFKGTFRQCLDLDTYSGGTVDGHTISVNSGKVILFEKSGTIGSAVSTQTYYCDTPYTMICGETAPSPGILLKNCQLWVSTNDVLVHHIRLRGVTNEAKDPSYIGPLSSSAVNNVVFDHVSASWGLDETFLIGNYGGGSTENVTVNNCIVAEGTSYGGEDAKCFLVQSVGHADQITNLCLSNNFLGASYHRHPNMDSSKIAFVNNYVYNAINRATTCHAGAYATELSIVGNVTEGGPGSGVFCKNYIFSTFTSNSSGWTYKTTSKIYSEDNKCDAGTQSAVNNWDLVDDRSYGNVESYVVSATKPLWPTGLTAISSANVKATVLANSGCRPADRDSVDTRLVNEAKTGTGISTQLTSTPAFPVLAENTITLAIPANPHGDDDGDGYTNLEKWLHSYAAEVEGTGVKYTRSRGINRQKPRFNQYGGRFV